MDEHKDFENQWRDAFENASETPPPRLWEQIEARLDKEDEDRVLVIPFWQRWQTWSAAASVAALLLVGGIWLYQESQESLKKQVSLKSQNSQTIQTKEAIAKTQLSNSQTTQPSEATAKSNLSNSQTTQPSEAIAKTQLSNSQTTQTAQPSEAIAKANLSNSLTIQTAQPNEATQTAQTTNLKLLLPKELQALRGSHKKQIWVAYQAPETSQRDILKKTSKEYWASVGVMPASFNAGVGIGGRAASSTFAFAGQNALARTADIESPTDKSSNRAMASYAVQWQGGLQMGKRWSFETGIHYLQGNSVFEAINGFNPLTNSYINNLEAAVNLSDFSEKNKAYAQASANVDKAQIASLTTTQAVSNSYQYLQIPLQAGFAVVKPKRKLSVWLLGGIINNVFLRNSFQTGQERTVTLNSADSPYRALSLAASTGVRLQYRIHKRWATTLTGNYQQSLGSTTREASLFEARPQLFGVGAGLRYGF